MRWAIVIGIDEYGDKGLELQSAVTDALMFRDWVLSAEGGNVHRSKLCLLLGQRNGGAGVDEDAAAPTKQNIVATINDVVEAAEGEGGAETLYFFFSGHGITADLAGREESALIMPGFDERHTEHSLAVRSLAEHLETTPFRDQFFFLDACRKRLGKCGEIGRWPIPRRRDPGKPPVQQFILYATSPGLVALQRGWSEEAMGAFTEVLMDGLHGDGRAKRWSWERNCYEVRWERLAAYVNEVMGKKKFLASVGGEPPVGGWPIQIPQDAGSRGVADRDRDARLAVYPRGHFDDVKLTLKLTADPKFDQADVTVVDAVNNPVVRDRRVPGGSPAEFILAPGTYAARVTTPDKRVGNVKAPIDLYTEIEDEIKLRVDDGPPPTTPGIAVERLGQIEIVSHDRLATAEIRDEAGCVVAVHRCGRTHRLKRGFYRVGAIPPERMLAEQSDPTKTGEEKQHQSTFVMLLPSERRRVRLRVPPPPPYVAKLVNALGGRVRANYVVPYDGAEPIAWARPSSVLTAALGGALVGDVSLEGLGLAPLSQSLECPDAGIALYAVASNGDETPLKRLAVRTWPTGEAVPPADERSLLEPKRLAVAGTVTPVRSPGPRWLSLERNDDQTAIVVAVPVLPHRLATIVAEVGSTSIRLYQFHPAIDSNAPSTAPSLRRLEHVERLLLGGGVDGARPLAKELAREAAEDPFAGLVAGYVLLRLGLYEPLEALSSAIISAAPGLSDAYILRAEREAHAGRTAAAHQAFADAVNAGIPTFGEGLTRLVEGLRVSAFHHPRGALIRHIFGAHVRGVMWSAFTPSRPLEPGRLVISGADLGYEG